MVEFCASGLQKIGVQKGDRVALFIPSCLEFVISWFAVVRLGAAVMKGYYNNPQATGEPLKGGWLHTGDLGKMDEDGYTYILDRKKDMIICSGYNV